jgi:transcriptional regulator with XRE-family HTH domain
VVTNQNTIDGGERDAFAARLRAAMHGVGHTRATLAQEIGVHENRVGDWMAARRWPHVRHVALAALALGVSIDSLLSDRDGPSPVLSPEDRRARHLAQELAELAPQLNRLTREAKRAAGR